MENRFMRIDTNFLDGDEEIAFNSVYTDSHSKPELLDNYPPNDLDSLQNETVFQINWRKKDEALIIIENTINTKILTQLILGFQNIKNHDPKTENYPANLSVNNSNIIRNQSYINLLHEFPVTDSKGPGKGGHSRSLSKGPVMTNLTQSIKEQSVISKQRVQGGRSKGISEEQISGHNNGSKGSSLNNIKSKEGQPINKRIQKLENLISSIKKEKEFQKYAIPKQKQVIPNFSIQQQAIDSKPPPYIVFFMQEMKGIRKQIHELKNINESILKESRAASLRDRSKSRNYTENGHSQHERTQHDFQLKLPLSRFEQAKVPPPHTNFQRNRTERKIPSPAGRTSGNLSQRKQVRKMSESDSLMRLKKLRNIKEEYSARIQQLRNNLKVQQQSKNKISLANIEPQAPKHEGHAPLPFHSYHQGPLLEHPKQEQKRNIPEFLDSHKHEMRYQTRNFQPKNIHQVPRNNSTTKNSPLQNFSSAPIPQNHNRIISFHPQFQQQHNNIESAHYPEMRVITKPSSVIFNGTVYQPGNTQFGQVNQGQNRPVYLPYNMYNANNAFDRSGANFGQRKGDMIPNKVSMR